MALGVPGGRPEGLLAVHWGLLGVSWGSLGWPLRLLEGLLALLGASRTSRGLSWGRFWSVRAAKRYQHDAKMDIQSSTALKKARFPFYECTGLEEGFGQHRRSAVSRRICAEGYSARQVQYFQGFS